jgi:hypothetical protein
VTKVAAFAVAVAFVVAAGPDLAAQRPTFHAVTSVVEVSTSVKRGNSAVANLTAEDFRLTDNGVLQVVEAVTIESMPIDVTLFLDSSGSTAAALSLMRNDLQSILRLLRAGDRFRLLTIDDAVSLTLPWMDAGGTASIRFQIAPGISLIRDALMFGLLYSPEVGRRHLVVGITDREDCGSLVPSTLFLELAGRSDAVLHIVQRSGQAVPAPSTPWTWRVRGCTPLARPDGAAIITQAAERTGGGTHDPSGFLRIGSVARTFRTIFTDFRQSYVLRYSPKDVPATGWHSIAVEVPGIRGATVRARQGYYGG